MKQLSVLTIALLTVGLFNACKKKTLPEAEEGNDPQFYFSGKVNGTDIRLDAGVNDYYMYSGYSQNSTTNVYGFSATLKQSNCTSCNNSIKIEINDHRYSAYNGPSGIDSAFLSTYYPFCVGTWAPVEHQLTFYPIFNNTPQSYFWNFGDGSTSSLFNPSHTYRNSGEYKVSLTVVDNFSCSNTVNNIQKVGFDGVYCNTTITVTSTSTLNATFTHSTIGTPPYNFYWDLGDGNFSNAATPSHTYASQGRYPVSLKVIDAANDTAKANFNYVTNASNICTTNYLVTKDSALTNAIGVSNIIIKWTDAGGTEYTSNSSLQPSTSYFKIISVSDYHTNEVGQKTKKLHVKFKCNVYNGTASLPIDNGEAVVVVAYK